MEKSCVHIIHVKKFSTRIPIAPELLSILDLPTDGVLWKQTDNEYYLFSKGQRDVFVHKMKTESWMSKGDFEYNKQGLEFLRWLHEKAGPVKLKDKQLYFPTETMTKLMQTKEFAISIYR